MTRISYTLIELYRSGKTEEMIDYYFGVKREPTQAMERGKEIDLETEEFIHKFGRLPQYAGGRILKSPITQPLYEVEYKGFLYVWRPDCVDIPELYEFKSGVTDLSSYLSKKQVDIYMFLCGLIGKEIERGFLIKADPNRTPDWYLIVNNKSLQDETAEYLTAISSEIEKTINEYVPTNTI